ncbi:ricin-type beta-trefoil lectin domain protein [Actinoplanes sp. NPDC024001]|uniref:ricin-type beta-trefoil lectin domain protein n=1 Tax=Actinoplanes sp. NPDC024001 TaxID=3154598 RepID=UPI0033FC34BB
MMLHRRTGDDRGSLPLAMMIVTVGVVLSIAFLPLIVRQVTSTRTLVDRNTALSGARIGLDVVMAQIAAAALDKDGRVEDLPPCTVKGDAGVGDEKLEYEVTIEYYDENAEVMTCPLTKPPKTAKLTSKGSGALNAGTTDSPSYSSRTLNATYTLELNNENIDGGPIWISSSTAGKVCMDSGSKTPVSGAAVKMQLCNGSSTQQFQYTKELYLHLVNSETTAAPDGMCVHAGDSHLANNDVVLRPCPTGAIAPVYQWSLDGSSLLRSTSSSQVVEGLCISLKTANKTDVGLKLATCAATGTLMVWRFDYGVGAGMAGAQTFQLVNYAQFSRCLDVTNQSVTYAYMIAWFCKQDPKGKVDWNQIWVHPQPVAPASEKKGPIVVTKSNVKYCLKSPEKATASSWVTVVQCPANVATLAVTALPKELVWNVRYDTGSYTTSFRIEDNGGLCLQPTDLTKATKDTTHTDGTSRIMVATCNSSELQKWNAPANLTQKSPLGGIKEN